MKRAWWIGIVCSSGWLWFASSAHAQTVPTACMAARNAAGFRAGYAGGGSLVRQAWANVNDCDRVEEVEAAVKTSLARALPKSSPTTYLECRFAGLAAGAVDEIDGLFSSCADSCYLEGQFVGEVVAVAYCELSILLGGLGVADYFLRGPVQVCGLSFEIACDESFVSTSIGYSNWLGACLPYTRAPFDEVFDQTRENQCAYNPIPPEDP